MKNKILIFLLGAGVGSLVTWKIVEERYRRIANEEIESVSNYYKQREENVVKCAELFKDEKKEETIIGDVPWATDKEKEEYENQIDELGYSQEDEDCVVKVPQGIEKVAPYVIAPEEFGEIVTYETKTLYYYEDKILADEDDQIIDDPKNVIGDALDHFGEFEDDCIHVRDENIECDYEILRSMKIFMVDVYEGDN